MLEALVTVLSALALRTDRSTLPPPQELWLCHEGYVPYRHGKHTLQRSCSPLFLYHLNVTAHVQLAKCSRADDEEFREDSHWVGIQDIPHIHHPWSIQQYVVVRTEIAIPN